MHDAPLSELVAASRQLEKESPVLSRLHGLLPFVLLVGALVGLYLAGRLPRYAAAGAVSFFALGKLIILKGALPDNPFGMSTLEFGGLIFFMDCLVAYVFAYNLHRIYRIPRFGPWLEALQRFCRYWIHRHPWMRRWAFTGVILFVCFPLTGTGAPGGSILGRVVGLRPGVTLAAITLGSALGCSLLILFGDRLEPIFEGVQHEWWFNATGWVVIGVLVIGLALLGRRVSRAADAFADSQQAPRGS